MYMYPIQVQVEPDSMESASANDESVGSMEHGRRGGRDEEHGEHGGQESGGTRRVYFHQRSQILGSFSE